MDVVTIDSGPIGLTNDSINTPREKWPDLVSFRREYIHLQFGYDCRNIVDWLHDAERMWQPLGYASLNDLVQGGLGIDPIDVRMVVEWLKRYRPNQPVSYPEVVKQALLERGGQVGNQNAAKKNESDNCKIRFENDTLQKTLGEIAGNSADYLTARIARDHPDILENMKQRKYRSVRQAAIEAGIVKPKERYSLPSDPESAGKYLAERVDNDWMRAMVATYMKEHQGTDK